jgi:ribonuclease R
MKQQHKSQKQDQKLRDIGKLILRFMNKKASKIYNYKQIADGIEYKNRDKENSFYKLCTNCVQKIKLKKQTV